MKFVNFCCLKNPIARERFGTARRGRRRAQKRRRLLLRLERHRDGDRRDDKAEA